MLELVGHYIIQLIEATKYFGIFVLMALESALIPIPSEVTMPFSGFLVSQGDLSFVLVVIVGTLANLFGSIVAYYIGYFLEETVMLSLIKKYGKFILLSEHEYRKAEGWFKKYGDKVIFISRLLPGVRTVISLPAGMFEMDIKKFIIYTTLGCLVWSTILTYVGVALGKNWNTLEPIYRKFEFLVVALIIVAIVVYIEKHIGLRKKFFKK
ncbi:MAG TPA: DedA family protein [Patescibacteria group bacterium]|nr:DedA family protein [Patescibacteria group bacterium]